MHSIEANSSKTLSLLAAGNAAIPFSLQAELASGCSFVKEWKILNPPINRRLSDILFQAFDSAHRLEKIEIQHNSDESCYDTLFGLAMHLKRIPKTLDSFICVNSRTGYGFKIRHENENVRTRIHFLTYYFTKYLYNTRKWIPRLVQFAGLCLLEREDQKTRTHILKKLRKKQIEVLSLQAPLTAVDARILRTMQAWKLLETLIIGHASPECLAALFSDIQAPHLKTLTLYPLKGEQGQDELFRAIPKAFPDLRRISVGECSGVTVSGLRTFLRESKKLDSVALLGLGKPEQEQFADWVSRRKNRLRSAHFSPYALQKICEKNEILPQLEYVEYYGNVSTEGGFKAMDEKLNRLCPKRIDSYEEYTVSWKRRFLKQAEKPSLVLTACCVSDYLFNGAYLTKTVLKTVVSLSPFLATATVAGGLFWLHWRGNQVQGTQEIAIKAAS